MAAEAAANSNESGVGGDGASFDFQMPDFHEFEESDATASAVPPDLIEFLSGEETQPEVIAAEPSQRVALAGLGAGQGDQVPAPTAEPVTAPNRAATAPVPPQLVGNLQSAPAVDAAASATGGARNSIHRTIAICVSIAILAAAVGAGLSYLIVRDNGPQVVEDAPVILPSQPRVDDVKAVPQPLPQLDLPAPKVPDLTMPGPVTGEAASVGSTQEVSAVSPTLHTAAGSQPANETRTTAVSGSDEHTAVEVLSADVSPEMIEALRRQSQAPGDAGPSLQEPLLPDSAGAPRAEMKQVGELASGVQNSAIAAITDRVADVEAAVIKNSSAMASLEKATRETAQSIVALRKAVQEINRDQTALRAELNVNKQRISALESGGQSQLLGGSANRQAPRPEKAATTQLKMSAPAQQINHYVITAITENGAIVKHKETQEQVILLQGREVKGIGRIVHIDAVKRHVIVESLDGKRWRIGTAV